MLLRSGARGGGGGGGKGGGRRPPNRGGSGGPGGSCNNNKPATVSDEESDSEDESKPKSKPTSTSETVDDIRHQLYTERFSSLNAMGRRMTRRQNEQSRQIRSMEATQQRHGRMLAVGFGVLGSVVFAGFFGFMCILFILDVLRQNGLFGFE